MWITFALVSAFAYSIRSIIEKAFIYKIDKFILAFGLRFFALLFFLIPLFFDHSLLPDLSSLSKNFWVATLWVSLISSPLEILLYYKALQIEEVTFLIPLLSIAPIFTTLINLAFFNDTLTFFGIIGLFLTIFGVYILNIGKAKEGVLEPFKYLSSNKAARYMLAMITLYSLGVVIDKVAVNGSSPYLYSLINYSLVSLALFILAFLKSRNKLYQIKTNFLVLSILGGIVAIYTIFRNYSLSVGNAGYVSAILSSSVLFTVLMGGIYLKEKNISVKLFSVSIILSGLILLKIYG